MNQLTSKSIKSNNSKKLNEETKRLNDQNVETLFDCGLKKLEKVLEKSFKNEFIQSLIYLIKFEHKNQASFETSLCSDPDWVKIDYFLKQFKKICKQKTHLQLLIDKMLIVKKSCDTSVIPSSTKPKKNDDLSKLNNEITDLNNCEYFSLTNILIRVLFKLIKSNRKDNNEIKINDKEISLKLFNLLLGLLSSTADICHYTEIRLKILEDQNLKPMLYIFASKTSNELMELIKTKNINSKMSISTSSIKTNTNITNNEPLASSIYTIENMRKLWSKMCRLSANLFHEKYTQQIKDLYSNEFISSLCDLVEHLQYTQLQSNVEIQMDDLEFYHSLLRFLKYGCELTKFKSIILEKRLIVYLCRFMYKLNKSIDNFDKNVQDSSNNDKELNTKAASINDLIKQHLIFLDNWPQPISTEYYNQLIEGNAIEHLLYLYTEEKTSNEFKVLKRSSSCLTINSLSSSSSSSSFQVFNISEYSFNFLFKLCRDYSNCRAEFGRQGGLSKYINKIESINIFNSFISNDSSENNQSLNELKEYEKLIEMLCLCCKESVNRMRLREQSHLIYLVKLQQKLHLNKNEINKFCKINTNNSSESAWHNKLLVALCCFAHDSESMNILLNNGLIECLLAYLRESIEESATIKELKIKETNTNEFLFNKISVNFKIPLIDLIKTKENETKSDFCLNDNLQRKRKTSEPSTINTTISSFIQTSVSTSNLLSKPTTRSSKRQKISTQSNDLSPPFPHPRLISPTQQNNTSQSIESNLNYLTDSILTDNNNQNHVYNQFQWKSPTESYCDSLSPALNAFSPTFSLSPPQNNNSRSNSAIMFSHQSPNSPMTEFSLSPYLNWPNSVDNENNNIQFSPSIKNENSDEEEELEDNDTLNNDSITEEKINKSPLRKFSSNSSICDMSFEINNSLKRSTSLASSIDSSTTQHIESINRTEACVFYVLSQLTHGDKPSSFLLNNFNNFDSILICLLNYLKYAKIRNPRALRILNRLTKNQYCFTNFVLSQFPYKVKKILFDENSQNQIKNNSNEKDIEKEMNVYLNSNKVFFDTHTFFPSFESIEFTLCNNLKSQCISSSDHGYLSLVTMMKQSSKRFERVSCSFVAPFILRNSKALNYIMVHLNGLDTILDGLLSLNQSITTDDQKEDLLINESLKQKSLLCIKKILSFLNYKRNIAQVNSFYDLLRKKFNNISINTCDYDVCFTFENEEIDKKVQVVSNTLSKKSEYFCALLTGDYMEKRQRDSNNIQTIQIKQVSYETFSIIIYMLGCGSQDITNFMLTFDLCYDLILACDQFFLVELKDLFISILICKFLSLSTWPMCFKLAYYLNNSFLANASMDFLFSILEKFPMIKSDLRCHFENHDKTDFEQLISNKEDDYIECIDVLEALLDCLKSDSIGSNNMINQDKQIIDYFRKVLKNGLIEIIKNNYWKL